MNAPTGAIEGLQRSAFARGQSLAQLWETGAFEFVTIWFTDLSGRWMRLSWPREAMNYQKLVGGIHSSVLASHWRDATNCDYLFKADADTAFIDPCEASPTLSLIANVWEPDGSGQYARDPRGVLLRAIKQLERVASGCLCKVGPELEFYIFDEVRYKLGQFETYVRLIEAESSSNSERTQSAHNRGYVLGHSSLHLSPTSDYTAPTREAILRNLAAVGLSPLHNFHEAGPAQAEIGISHLEALRAADAIQLYKRVARATATKLGQLVTFMPAPIPFAPGSGLHFHLSIWSEGVNLFSGSGLGGMSETAMHAIAGVMKYSKALCAFLTPSHNSFCRLSHAFNPIRDVEFGVSNRRIPIRIPPALEPNEARIELRFPDASCNPYLALASIIVAMVAGIEQRLEPGAPAVNNAPGFLGDVRNRAKNGLPRDLEEAPLELDKVKDVFLRDDVFSEEMLNAHIELLSRRALFRATRGHPADYAECLDC